jgi:hypothetical protein
MKKLFTDVVSTGRAELQRGQTSLRIQLASAELRLDGKVVRTWDYLNGLKPSHKETVAMIDALLPIETIAPDPAPVTGYVYFIRVIGTNMVKIGYTTNPVKCRLSQLQVGNPRALEVLETVQTPDYKDIEGELHQKLASRRIRGEWFNLEQDVDCCDLIGTLGYTITGV